MLAKMQEKLASNKGSEDPDDMAEKASRLERFLKSPQLMAKSIETLINKMPASYYTDGDIPGQKKAGEETQEDYIEPKSSSRQVSEHDDTAE